MVGTFRHKRKTSKRQDQVLSELYKIFKNKREGKLYPKKLIWGTVDALDSPTITPNNIKSIMIYDIDYIIDQCDKGLYRIDEELTPEKNLRFDGPDGEGSYGEADIMENYDRSSSFVILWEMEPEFSYSHCNP